MYFKFWNALFPSLHCMKFSGRSQKRCTGLLSQGRAKLRAFPRYFFVENTQLSPSLTQKPCIMSRDANLPWLYIFQLYFVMILQIRAITNKTEKMQNQGKFVSVIMRFRERVSESISSWRKMSILAILAQHRMFRV